MHGGRARNSLRSNSLDRLSAVCIQLALRPLAHVALATCPIHACHIPCDANFCIKKLLKDAPVKRNRIQLELLNS